MLKYFDRSCPGNGSCFYSYPEGENELGSQPTERRETERIGNLSTDRDSQFVLKSVKWGEKENV